MVIYTEDELADQTTGFTCKEGWKGDGYGSHATYLLVAGPGTKQAVWGFLARGMFLLAFRLAGIA